MATKPKPLDAALSRRRRIVRFLMLAGIAGSVLAFGAAFLPISLPALDRRLENEWFNATDTKLRFDRATWDVALRRLRVTGVEILLPGHKRPVATFQAVEARWSWRWGKPFVQLGSVEATVETSLNINIEDWKRIQLGPRLESLVQLGRIFSDLGTRRSTPPRTFPLLFRLRAARLHLNAIRAQERGSSRLATIEMPSIDWTAQPGKNSSLGFGGFLRRPSGAWPAIRGWAFPRDGATVYSLWCRSFDSAQEQRMALPFDVSGKDWKAKLTLQDDREEGTYALQVSLGVRDAKIARLPFDLPQTGESDCSLKTELKFNPQTRQLSVETFGAKAFGSSLQGKGEVVLDGEIPFSFDACDLTVSPDSLNLLQALLPPKMARVVPVQEGRCRLLFDVTGDRTGLNRELSKCHARLDNLKVWPKGLRGQIGPLQLDAKATSRGISIERFDLQADGNRLSLVSGEGTYGPDGWHGDMAVRGNWSADLQAQSLLSLFPRDWLPVLEKWRLEGKVTGHGSVAGTWGRAPQAAAETGETNRRFLPFLPFPSSVGQALNGIGMDGILYLSDGLVYHPLLPGPIQGLSGGIRVTDTYADCTDLEGRMLGSSVVVSARVGGPESYWPHPDIDLRLFGNLDVSRLPEVLDAKFFKADWFDVRKRALLARLHPQGEAQIRLTAIGPLFSPDELKVTGRLSLKDIACEMDTPVARGRLDLDHLLLQLDPRQLRLDKMDGHIGPIRINAQGRVRPEKAELKFSASGALDDYRKVFPPLLADSDALGGKAEVRGELTASLKPDGTPGPKTPLAFLLAATGAVPSKPSLRLDPGWLRENFDWDFGADIIATEAKYTHKSMPVEVTGINGRFHADRKQFRTLGFVRAQWGESADSLTTGSIRWAPLPSDGPNPPVRIRFASRFPSFRVDEWVQPWGPNRKLPREKRSRNSLPPQNTFDPEKKYIYTKRLDVRGTITGEHVSYKRLRSRRTSGMLECHVYEKQPVFLEITYLKGEIFDGRASTDLAFLFRPTATDWYWRTDCQDLDLRQLVVAVRPHGPSETNGLLSGHLAVGGVVGQLDTFTGAGNFALGESRFLKEPIFSGLGKMLSLKTLEDVSFHQVNGPFTIDKGIVDLPRVVLDGKLLDLIASGRIDLQGPLDLTFLYQFLRVIDGIPILKLLPKAVETVGGKFLKIHVTGTLNDPKVRVVPLSLGETRLFSKK